MNLEERKEGRKERCGTRKLKKVKRENGIRKESKKRKSEQV